MAKGKKTGGRNFQPGQSGNPAGGKPLPEDIKEIRSTQPYEVSKIINQVMWMSQGEAKKRWDDQSIPNIERLVLKVINKAIAEGCVTRLTALCDRWLGRVKEVVMFVPAGAMESDPSNEDKREKINGAQLIELMKRAQPKCQSHATKKSTTKRARS